MSELLRVRFWELGRSLINQILIAGSSVSRSYFEGCFALGGCKQCLIQSPKILASGGMKFGQDEFLEGLSVSLQLPSLRTYKMPTDGSARASSKKTTYKVTLGGPVWGCAGWKGNLYPEKAQAKDFLKHYAEALGAIELNATFYGIPPDERLQNWKAAASPGFHFCPKIPRHITNARDIHARIERIEHFWRSFALLGEHLGMAFFQFSDKQGLDILPDLAHLLKRTPRGQKVAVEFRHPDFFVNNELLPEVCEFLAEHSAHTVISDTLGRREVLHPCVVGDSVMIRFLGENGSDRDQERLEIWLERIAQMQDQGVREIYFFIHQPDEENSAYYFEWFSSLLNSMQGNTTKQVKLHKPLEATEEATEETSKQIGLF